MRLTRSKQGDVATVAERWKRQYCSKGGIWHHVVYGSSEDIYNRLVALGPNGSPSAVAEIVGNDGWTGEEACNECGAPSAVMLGDEPDYESSTCFICRACLLKALDLTAAPSDTQP